jgi:adenylate cyclase, class 2
MGKEYEAKFLDIDVDATRQKLLLLGGMKVHENKKYIRAAFKLCNTTKKGYARVRDEDGKITMTVKIYNNPDYPDEYEVNLESGTTFEQAKGLFLALGLEMKAYQESYREKWTIPSHENIHEITFDTLPGLPTYLEVDCITEEALNDAIILLDLDISKKRTGAFDRTYNEYYDVDLDDINNNISSLTFKNIRHELKDFMKKGHDELDEIRKIHKEMLGEGSTKTKSKKSKSMRT